MQVTTWEYLMFDITTWLFMKLVLVLAAVAAVAVVVAAAAAVEVAAVAVAVAAVVAPLNDPLKCRSSGTLKRPLEMLKADKADFLTQIF